MLLINNDEYYYQKKGNLVGLHNLPLQNPRIYDKYYDRNEFLVITDNKYIYYSSYNNNLKFNWKTYEMPFKFEINNTLFGVNDTITCCQLLNCILTIYTLIIAKGELILCSGIAIKDITDYKFMGKNILYSKLGKQNTSDVDYISVISFSPNHVNNQVRLYCFNSKNICHCLPNKLQSGLSLDNILYIGDKFNEFMFKNGDDIIIGYSANHHKNVKDYCDVYGKDVGKSIYTFKNLLQNGEFVCGNFNDTFIHAITRHNDVVNIYYFKMNKNTKIISLCTTCTLKNGIILHDDVFSEYGRSLRTYNYGWCDNNTDQLKIINYVYQSHKSIDKFVSLINYDVCIYQNGIYIKEWKNQYYKFLDKGQRQAILLLVLFNKYYLVKPYKLPKYLLNDIIELVTQVNIKI